MARLPMFPPPHLFCNCVFLKELRGLRFVSAHSKGLTRGQLRPKPGKTRCLLGTAHSKGLKPANSRQLAVNTSRRMKSLRARRVSRWRFPVGKGRGRGSQVWQTQDLRERVLGSVAMI